jgi:hypothetical protein
MVNPTYQNRSFVKGILLEIGNMVLGNGIGVFGKLVSSAND